MKKKNLNGNWKKKCSSLLAFAMVASLATSPVYVNASSKSVTAISLSAVEAADDTQVLVIGKTYSFGSTSEKASYKSSNPSVATVSKTGEITAQKRGIATISETTESGKKTSRTFWVVSSGCSTSYQTTLDKMLEASNINRLVVRNLTGKGNYIIKKGDYNKKTIFVRAPKSDVKNYGNFKLVNLKDVDQTWREYGNNNRFKISDKDMTFVVAASSTVNAINYSAVDGELNLETMGQVKAVKVTGNNAVAKIVANTNSDISGIRVSGEDARVVLRADGTVDKVVIENKSDVVIRGLAESVAVEFTAEAEGAKVISTIPVKATAAANVTIELKKGAEESTIQKASDKVALTVSNQTAKEIKVTTKSSDKVETIAAGVISKPDATPVIPYFPVPGGDSGAETPTLTTAIINANVEDGGKKVTFTLPTSYENIKSASVKATVNVLGFDVSETFTLTDKMLGYANKYMTDEDHYQNVILDRWYNLESYTRKDNAHTTTVTGEIGYTKKVDVDGRWGTVTANPDNNTITAKSQLFDITVTKVDNNVVTVKGKTNTYIVTKTDTSIVITSDVVIKGVNKATLTVTY